MNTGRGRGRGRGRGASRGARATPRKKARRNSDEFISDGSEAEFTDEEVVPTRKSGRRSTPVCRNLIVHF